MKTDTTALLASRPASLLSSVLLFSLWAIFGLAHLAAFRVSAEWSQLVFCTSETLMAAMFLLRSDAKAVSHSPVDWLLAIAGTAAPFLLQPVGDGVLPQASFLIFVGSAIQISGVLSLNRSFALVAARRELKTGGVYRFVRHPLYASYLISYLGYLLSNTSLRNTLAVGAGALLLLARLHREERFLSQQADYRIYQRAVKYRLFPLVY